MDEIVYELAKKINNCGGRAYFVGGYVRDKILNIPNKDIDIEVHGVTPNSLKEILNELGEMISFGESFGIYSLKGHDIDIALPRKERKVGLGHKDFEVSVDPYIGVKAAARRRDFTINSLMEDILTGEIVDSFNGLNDLKNGVIRHICDKTFIEDPLRVFRGAQFSSRFEFEIADETIELCKNIDVTNLSRERIEEELKKALLKSKKPSIFFNELRKMDKLNFWFKEVNDLIGLKQDKIYHPEGDVFIHTMEVLDRGIKYIDYVSNPYSFMLLLLTHDFGKIITTVEKDDRIHSYNHETLGLPIIETFLKRITNEKDVIEYVLNMVPLHMKPNMMANLKSQIKSTNKMFDSAKSPKDLIYFAISDKEIKENKEFLFDRLDKYNEIIDKPYIKGQDLIELGITPGVNFKEILSYSHKLKLAGIDKESALKQVISYYRDLEKKR